MTLKILNKRSVAITGDVSDAPLPSDLEYGEIAVNYANVDPALFIRDSNDVVRRFPVDAGPNEKYAIANDSTSLVGNDTTTAINAALIASGDIASTSELHVSDQCQITDSGSPDFNAVAPIGQYLWDGTVWFVGGGGGVSQIVAGNNVTVSPANGEGVVTVNSTGIDEAPVDGQQYGRQNAGWSVITGGGGGGDIIYNGASAWALTDNSGNLLNGLNIASVTRTAGGKYDYVFTTPMPSADYSLVGNVTDTTGGSTNGFINFSNLTATGFTVTTKDGSNNTSNRPHSLAVFAANALPPEGGTGTDSWATFDSTGNVTASFNASVSFVTTGEYQVAFTTPMPTANYAVTTGGLAPNVQITSQTANGFTYNTSQADGAASNYGGSFSVNATNATLPLSFTSEQIEAAINNPGLSAWGFVNAGILINGLNVNSVISNPQIGVYNISFVNPMPDSDYSVVATSGLEVVGNATNCSIGSKTINGFQIVINRVDTGASINQSFQFQVAATNALPPKGGTGTDAWATVDRTTANGACNVPASFNIAEVERGNAGNYIVKFTTPMPTANYAVQITGEAFNGVASGAVSTGKQTDQFIVVLYNSGTGNAIDVPFNFAVNATNATLPSTFTVAQFNDLVARVTALENA